MNDWENLLVQLPKEIAEKVQKDGYAEIVQRGMRSRFQAMVKCPLQGIEHKGSSGDDIAGAFMKAYDAKYNPLKSAGLFRQIQGNTLSAASLKNMSNNMDILMKRTGAIAGLGKINVLLGATNLVVSTVGTVIITKKLKEMSSQLDSMNDKLEQIGDTTERIEKNFIDEKIRECQELTMKYNQLSDDIRYKRNRRLADFEDWLTKAVSFMNEILRNKEDGLLDIELATDLVFSLIPAYTLIFSEFVYKAYYRNHALPSNYENFMEIYEKLSDKEFKNQIFDYYFLDKEFNYFDALDASGAHNLFIINGKTIIEDQVELVKGLSKKEFLEYNKQLDIIAEKRKMELMPEVAAETNMDSEELAQLLG